MKPSGGADRWVDLWWSNPVEFDGVGLETAPTFAKDFTNAHARHRTTHQM